VSESTVFPFTHSFHTLFIFHWPLSFPLHPSVHYIALPSRMCSHVDRLFHLTRHWLRSADDAEHGHWVRPLYKGRCAAHQGHVTSTVGLTNPLLDQWLRNHAGRHWRRLKPTAWHVGNSLASRATGRCRVSGCRVSHDLWDEGHHSVHPCVYTRLCATHVTWSHDHMTVVMATEQKQLRNWQAWLCIERWHDVNGLRPVTRVVSHSQPVTCPVVNCQNVERFDKRTDKCKLLLQ